LGIHYYVQGIVTMTVQQAPYVVTKMRFRSNPIIVQTCSK